MSKHTITIKNLGPIKEIIDFEINKINLLIGKSASGKSLLAKAVFLFNTKFMFLFYRQRDNKSDATLKLNSLLEDFFPNYKGYTLRYHYTPDFFIQVKKSKGKAVFFFSDALREKVESLMAQSKRVEEVLEKANRSSSVEDVEEGLKSYFGAVAGQVNVIAEIMRDLNMLPATFIPDTRSFVSNFDQMRLDKLNSDSSPLPNGADEGIVKGDPTLRHFSDISGGLIQHFKSLEDDEHKQLLKGDVTKTAMQKLVFSSLHNGQNLDISEVSSGQKELFPIVLVLQELAKTKSPRLLIIEEPEVHLFPDEQKAVFESIIKCVNQSNSKVLITTHAPHLLTTANNLLKACEYDYAPLQDKFIDFADLNAQKVKDGTARSILNTERKLIDASYIENIFDIIAHEFSEIITHKKRSATAHENLLVHSKAGK